MISTLNRGMARLSLRHVRSHAIPTIGMRDALDAMACEVGLSALVERRLGDDRRRLPGPHRLAAVDAVGDGRLVLDLNHALGRPSEVVAPVRVDAVEHRVEPIHPDLMGTQASTPAYRPPRSRVAAPASSLRAQR